MIIKLFNDNYQDQIKDINEQSPDFLEPARKSGYVCPRCGSGSGKNGTGIVLNPKGHQHYHCFSCGLNEDVFGLYRTVHPELDTATAVKELSERYRLDYNVHPTSTKTANSEGDHPAKATEMSLGSEQPDPEIVSFLQGAYNQNDYIYLENRGISRETQQNFKIGKDGDYCIIPTDNGYIARNTLPESQIRYKNPKGVTVDLFNTDALKNSYTVICEGAIDALSLEEIGIPATACNSIANIGLVTTYLTEHPNLKPELYLMFDKDKAGQDGQQKLYNELIDKGYTVNTFDAALYPSSCKDVNDFLLLDRYQLAQRLKQLTGISEYKAADIVNLFDFENPNCQQSFKCPTGFKNLDKLLGEIHAGLYILGAVSSLGKTTFLLQVADQIAATGQDVIFLSLEMSKLELVAKSLSRYSYMQNGENMAIRPDRHSYTLAKTVYSILDTRGYKYLSLKEVQALQASAAAYKETAGEHLYIYEGKYKGQRIKPDTVGIIVEQHLKKTGNKPVIIIDYLQILEPTEIRATDKQNTDTAVKILKDITTMYNIPVIAISSFNRDNYTQPVNLASFKESGAIEYSSDVLLGLQLAGMDYQIGETDANRLKRVRELQKTHRANSMLHRPSKVELKVLKNRIGVTDSIMFEMVAAYNYFKEK